VKKVEGVGSAEFNLLTSQLKVMGDGKIMSRLAIVQIVERQGTRWRPKIRQVSVLHIEGWTARTRCPLFRRR